MNFNETLRKKLFALKIFQTLFENCDHVTLQ